MEINPGQEQESKAMNNEEIQPGIAMETASPLDQLDRKRGCTLLLKGGLVISLITKPMARPRSTLCACLIFSL